MLVSVITFIYHRDRIYIFITATVLCLLLLVASAGQS